MPLEKLFKVKYEPVLIGKAISALAGLLGAFGFHLTGEQVAAIVVVVNLVVGLIVRDQVTPVAKIEDEAAEKNSIFGR